MQHAGWKGHAARSDTACDTACGTGGAGDLDRPHGFAGLLQHGQDGGTLRRHRSSSLVCARSMASNRSSSRCSGVPAHLAMMYFDQASPSR